MFRCTTLRDLLRVLVQIRDGVYKLADSIVTRDEFDAALADGVTKIKTSLDDLTAAVAAGKVVTPEDFAAELSTLQGIVASAVSVDPGGQVAVTIPPTETAATTEPTS